MESDRPALLLLVMAVGVLWLSGCSRSSSTDYAPLQEDIDAGLEVWEVQITSPYEDESEAQNGITRYFVLDDGQVVREYIHMKDSSEPWREETGRENVTIDGSKKSDGSIEIRTITDSLPMDIVMKYAIADGAVKGELECSGTGLKGEFRTEHAFHGTARKMNP